MPRLPATCKGIPDMRAMALFVVAVSLRLGGTLAWGASETAPTPPALESLAAEALARSAELAALRARIRAAEAEATAAGTLPSPMAFVTLSSVPVGTAEIDQDPMSGVEVGLSQTLPGGSKLGLRRRMGDQGAAALRFRYQDRRNDLIRQVKWVYYDLQYLDEALTIAEQNRDLAKDFLAAAEASYATGKGLQQDVFMAQVRLSGMLDALVSLRQRRAAAAARLNQLLYRPGATACPRCQLWSAPASSCQDGR